MARPKSTGPTEGELAILQVLWERGPSTVRQVHDALRSKTRTGYTTTLKLLQIMAEKGLVVRDITQRTHIYRAKQSEGRTLRRLMRNMIDKVFQGSVQKIVMHALSAKKTSPKGLAEIRKLLDKLVKNSK